LAKEKGFNIEVKTYFDVKKFGEKPVEFFGKLDANNFKKWDNDLKQNIPAGYISNPSQSLLQKWIRKIHNIHIKIDDFIDDITGIEWDFEVATIGTNLDKDGNYIPLISYSTNDPNRKFKSYEEALELALIEVLNLISND